MIMVYDTEVGVDLIELCGWTQMNVNEKLMWNNAFDTSFAETQLQMKSDGKCELFRIDWDQVKSF